MVEKSNNIIPYLQNLHCKCFLLRQVTGPRKRPEHFIKEIDSVMAAYIQRVAERVAQRLLSSPPPVAARGAIHNLPEMSHITDALDVRPLSPQERQFSSFVGLVLRHFE